MEWGSGAGRDVAAELLSDRVTRWLHVTGVARAVIELGGRSTVVAAAWLHDIGYADGLVRTGMHAIDGANHLDHLGAPSAVVSLVAFHTGAEFEAHERGLLDLLLQFDLPDQDELDLLTLADMTTGASGERVTVEQRISEIFERYDPAHPVYRAVIKSRGYLEECCRRTSKATGYPM